MTHRKVIFLFALLAAPLQAAEMNWREAWDPAPRARWMAKPENELRQQAAAGHPIAMWMLAVRLYGEDKNREAAQWRDKAAQAGVPQAIYEQGSSLAETNLKLGIPLLEKSAAAGYPLAQIELAEILQTGRADPQQFIVKPNPARAVELLQQAVDDGSINACFHLATLYAAGIGEPRHADDRPFVLFAYAASHGHEDAMIEMARRWRLGYGVEKDLLSSATWAARARLRHHQRFHGGKPVDPAAWIGAANGPDEIILAKISNLFADALENNSSKAALELAAMNAAGQHGSPNLPRAAALYTLAEKSGDSSAAAKRRELESKLTPEDRQLLQNDLKWMTTPSPR